MLKPLLRTLPTLSGNIKIACNVSNYTQIDNSTSEAYVTTGRLLPISHLLYQKHMPISFANSSYEFDIVNFYKAYSDYFFRSTFSFNKSEYADFSKTSTLYPRDTDFELGCKRVSYLKNGSQFCLYAPIYIESADDIPDYLKININFSNKIYSGTKTIKVLLNSYQSDYNYLYRYIKRYAEKIDSNVIFCSGEKTRNTYFGINLQTGGFTKVIDNVSNALYTKINTINNFDAIISNGFKRNKIAMKQILPLSFYFNINEAFPNSEVVNNSAIKVSCTWYKNDEAIPFYDFSTNYVNYKESVRTINGDTGKMYYANTGINIMDVPYPSLNESQFIYYKYSNKLTKFYSRWKLKYSSDTHPYVTNMSWGFTYNYSWDPEVGKAIKSIYKYGEFPDIKYTISGSVSEWTNEDGTTLYNLSLPIIGDLSSKNKLSYRTVLNKYVTNWAYIIKSYDELFTTAFNWADVLNNKAYFKGVLYSFNNITNYFTEEEKPSFDKFGVFYKIKFTTINTVDNKYIYVDKIFNNGDGNHKTNNVISLNNGFIHNMTTTSFYSNTAKNDAIYTNLIAIDNKDTADGDYINLSDYGVDYYDTITGFKLSEIKQNANLYNAIITSAVPIITSYEMLPVFNGNQLFCLKNANKHTTDTTCDFVITYTYTEGQTETNNWVFDSLTFSTYTSAGGYSNVKTPIYSGSVTDKKNNELHKVIVDDTDVYNTAIYNNEESFVMLSDIMNASYNNDLFMNAGFSYNEIDTKIQDLHRYQYLQSNVISCDGTEREFGSNCFVSENVFNSRFYGKYLTSNNTQYDKNYIYVDPYNLNSVLRNSKNNSLTALTSVSTSNCYELYAKIPNDKFLFYYLYKVYKDENTTELNDSDILKTVYFKRRYIISAAQSTGNTIEIKDLYEPVIKYYPEQSDSIGAFMTAFRKDIEFNKPLIYKDDETNETTIKLSYTFAFKDIDSNLTNIEQEEKKEYLKKFTDEGWHLEDRFELYYKKKFIPLNEELLKFINVTNTPYSTGYSPVYKDLYLYTLYNGCDYEANIHYYYKHYFSTDESTEMLNDNYSGETTCYSSTTEEPITVTYTSYVEPYDKCLTPFYNSIFMESKEYEKIYTKWSESLISPVYVNDSKTATYYRYNLNDLNCLYDISPYLLRSFINKADTYSNICDSIDSLVNINNENYCTYSFAQNTYLCKYNISTKNENGVSKQYISSVNSYIVGVQEIQNIDGSYYNWGCYAYDPEYINGVLNYKIGYARVLYTYSLADDLSSTYMDNAYKSTLHTNEKHIINTSWGITTNYTYTYLTTSDAASIKDAEEVYGYIDGEYKPIALMNYFDKNKTKYLYKVPYNELGYTYEYATEDFYTYSYYDDLGLYDKYKINTYKFYTDDTSYTTYAWYSIYTEASNTSLHLNMHSSDSVNSVVKNVQYINKISITDLIESDNYFNIYKLLIPYMKARPFYDMINATYTVVIPQIYSLANNYIQQPLTYLGEQYSYNIVVNNNNVANLVFERYFDDIVPLLQECDGNIDNTYNLKYKEIKAQIQHSYSYCVAFDTPLNINNYIPIRIYSSESEYKKYVPVEYKHFNNSRIVNLETEFTIHVADSVNYSRLLELEEETTCIKYFKVYINNAKDNSFTDDEILFLYNKYKKEFNSTQSSINYVNKEKMYSLDYKFILL